MSKKFETFNLLLQQIRGEESEYDDSDIEDCVQVEYQNNADFEEHSSESYSTSVCKKEEVEYKKGKTITIGGGIDEIDECSFNNAEEKKERYFSPEELKNAKVTLQKDNSKIISRQTKKKMVKRCKNME